MENKVFEIREDYLNELIDLQGRTLCGKILKRFELFDNKDVLKSEIRELIYEGYRQFKELLIAHNYGLKLTIFKFKEEKTV